MNEEKIFDIQFESEGTTYKGWVNPSDKLHDDGKPASFHVVLNNVFFGNLSLSDGNWVVDEPRPAALIEAAGKQVEEYLRTKKANA